MLLSENSAQSFSTTSTSTFGSNNLPKTVTVPSSIMWVDTGIDLNDQQIQIQYMSGSWTWDKTPTHISDGSGAEIFKGTIVSNAPLAGLVGKVNRKMFFVGKNYRGSPGRGRLYLSINDTPDGFIDNTGIITVTVSQ